MTNFDRCLFFTLCGILLAIGVAMTLAAEKDGRKGLKNAGYTVTTISVIGYMIFGFLMFISFRWGYLLSGVVISGAIAAGVIALHHAIHETVQKRGLRIALRIVLTIVQLVLYIVCMLPVADDEKMVGALMALGFGLVMGVVYFLNKARWDRRRGRVLTDSPVMQQVVELCRSGNYVAVQILPDRVRLFSTLPTLNYCKSEDYNAASVTLKTPSKWDPWLKSGAWNLELIFQEYNYPAMSTEQMEKCADGLARRLGKFGVTHHHSSYSFTNKPYYDKSRSAYVRVTNVTHLFDDRLVFHLPTYREGVRLEEERQKARTKEAQSVPKRNSWE